MPSTDLLGGIDSIMDKVNSNTYSSQFEMDLEVSHLIKSAYDGHLNFQLCSQSVFSYGMDMPLVSISTDGFSLPQVYTLGAYSDPRNNNLVLIEDQMTQSFSRAAPEMCLLLSPSMALMWPNILKRMLRVNSSKIAMRSTFPSLLST